MDLTKTLPIMGKKKEVTLIAKDAELAGDISFSSQLIINGVLKGSTTGIDPGAAVTVSPTGRVIGDIRAPMVLIHGRVEGTVYAFDALEVADGAVIQGDLHYQVLQMHMGASVQGRLIHTVPEKANEDDAGAAEDTGSSAEEQTKNG
jgi:cytoskeletal protein CcmA (bactofilin family)